MRLGTAEGAGGDTLVAILPDDRILVIEEALGALAVPRAFSEWRLPGTMLGLIEDWDRAEPILRWLLDEATAEGAEHLPGLRMRGELRLKAPIPRPRKNVLCVGRNYYEHVVEGDRAQGQQTKPVEYPQLFTKPPATVIGPEDDILWFPALTQQLDYEAELAVIIGKPGRDIPAGRALEHVFGFSILNDVSARDLQRRHLQWFKGKSLDASCPLGPWMVVRDAANGWDDAAIRLWVNGELRQDSRTSCMMFKVPEIIEVLSAGSTLEAGDIIATGTPAGVGYAMEPPRFLADGDHVEISIEGIGTLSNRVRAA